MLMIRMVQSSSDGWLLSFVGSVLVPAFSSPTTHWRIEILRLRADMPAEDLTK